MHDTNIPRRRLLQFVAGAAAAPFVSRAAFAETYPSRPVHLIVGFSPGSASDINSRLVAQWLSERMGLYQKLGSKKKTLKLFDQNEGGAEHCQVDDRPAGVNWIADWLSENVF